MRRQDGGKDFQAFLDFHRRFLVVFGTLQQHREGVDIMRPEHCVYPRSPVEDFRAFLLGEASSHGNHHSGAISFHICQLPQMAVEFCSGSLTHRTGIQNHQVSPAISGVGCSRSFLRNLLNRHPTGSVKQASHAFGVVFVHLAAKRFHQVSSRSIHHRLILCHAANAVTFAT